MKIRFLQFGERIEIHSPAKLNLVLEVLCRRPDGYHEISSVLCPIDLWDFLEITYRPSSDILFELDVPDHSSSMDPAWRIPSDDTNLAMIAANLIRQELGITAGCRIRLKKNIPAAAGLGGGSGNAAATVVACLLLWSGWNRPLAEKVCQKLGSDTNFFLGSEQGFGLMHAAGRGEHTTLIPSSPSLAFWLTNPPQGCSTSEVYGRLLEMGHKGKIQDFKAACEDGQESKIGATLFNALQLSASQVNPWIQRQLDILVESGCSSVLATGSGSSCYGLVPEGGLFEKLRKNAESVGISRVYEVNAWYGDSIERQIQELGANCKG